MTKKTYIVRGLLEWKALLPAGGARIRVSFSGGKMGSSGLSPARFETSDPAMQHIIESSDSFRIGKIVLHKAEEIAAPRVAGRGQLPTEYSQNEEESGRLNPGANAPYGGGSVNVDGC